MKVAGAKRRTSWRVDVAATWETSNDPLFKIFRDHLASCILTRADRSEGSPSIDHVAHRSRNGRTSYFELTTEPERGVNGSLLCSSAIFLNFALASSSGISVDGNAEGCLGLLRRDIFRDPGMDVGAEGASARMLPGRVLGPLGSLTLVGLLPAYRVLLESSL